MLDFVVVIPARYASTRLPGKALVDIAGKPMVVHVAERAQRSGATEVWIATDDQRIVDSAHKHGYQAWMTSPDHASGTDRIAEVAAARDWSDNTIVVNVQGDEPRIAPELIREVAAALDLRGEASMSTACHAIHRAEDLFDPELREGRSGSPKRCPVLQPRDDTLGARCLCAGPDRHSHRPPNLPAHRHLRLSLRLLATLRNPDPLLTSSASKHWSSCARCGTGIESPSRSPRQPRKPESTPRRTWKPCVVCSPRVNDAIDAGRITDLGVNAAGRARRRHNTMH